jgi:hypothetical protein
MSWACTTNISARIVSYSVHPFRHNLYSRASYADDHFVHFDCTKLYGYDAAKKLCDENQIFTIEKLCTSAREGRLATYKATGFMPYEFTTEDLIEKFHKYSNGNYDGEKYPFIVTVDPENYD